MTSGPAAGPLQRRLLALLKRYPGLHLREIARQLSTSEQLAGYHLERLEARGLVEGALHEGYKRFSAAEGKGHPSPAEERLLEVLRKPIPFAVALHLLGADRATNAELAEAAGVSRPSVTYHLKSMEERGLLRQDADGAYRLGNPDGVADLLRKWKPTPDLIDRFASAWRGFYRAPRRG